MATIEDLQQEELLEIFSHYIQSEGYREFLKNIPRVCKAWNDLSSSASLWINVRACKWNDLLYLSARGLLYHTQSLEFENNEISLCKINLSPVLKNIRNLRSLYLKNILVGGDTIQLVTQHCPYLVNLCLKIRKPTTSHEWARFLTVCGPTLKEIDLEYYDTEEPGQRLLSGIAAKCPLLEKLMFFTGDALLPIYELRSGCLRIRELEFYRCRLITTGINDSLGCGFKNLKKFKAVDSDFGGSEVYMLLKDSDSLEHLELFNNDNLVLHNISRISSGKVSILKVNLDDSAENLNALRDAMWKWRHTLSDILLEYWDCDISYVIDPLLNNNPNPPLKSLVIIYGDIDSRFFEKFMQKCQSLTHLEIHGKEYEGREKIIEALEFLMKRQYNSC